MDELPTDAPDSSGAVAMDAMADTTDTAQLLDIDVDQLAGTISLVPDDRLLGLEVLKAREAVTSQDAGHGGRAQAHTGRDLRARIASPAQTQHLLDSIRMGLPRHPMRPGAAIDQGRLAGLSNRLFHLKAVLLDTPAA